MKKKKVLLPILAAIGMIFTSVSTCSVFAEINTDVLLSGKYNAEIVIEDYGTIQLELDADAAPITVTNFVKLANDGFYDGLTFHRIINGFMMQGGDPLGNGTGGSEEKIKGEFSSNGVENPISHKRGVISMARAMDKDSASSQFFIMHQDGEFLDGEYAAFGEVTEGIEVVDEICENAEVTDNNGTVKEGTQPVIESITISEGALQNDAHPSEFVGN
ncbi:MAG: peptidylprolyl isomerase [Blautia sp.]|nr:peptidylprolyl isomerase [Blautia sp.]